MTSAAPPPEARDQASVKRRLRTELLASRRERTPEERATIAEQLWSVLAGRCLGGVDRVGAYVPVGAEPGGRDLPERLRQVAAEVLLPVLRPDNDLDWAAYDGELAAAGRGLAEPPGPRLGVEAVAGFDLLLVPALAVDRRGHRLGRGGGSYDRALARVGGSVPRVALLYDDELLDEVPYEEHDEHVTAVVTPSYGWVTVT